MEKIIKIKQVKTPVSEKTNEGCFGGKGDGCPNPKEMSQAVVF